MILIFLLFDYHHDKMKIDSISPVSYIHCLMGINHSDYKLKITYERQVMTNQLDGMLRENELRNFIFNLLNKLLRIDIMI